MENTETKPTKDTKDTKSCSVALCVFFLCSLC